MSASRLLELGYPPDVLARFWAKVNKDGPIVRAELGPCWIWTASTQAYGHGQLRIDGRSIFAHRISWEVANLQSIPQGMCGCHKCDNPPCVNPDHIFIGTHTDNMQDAWRKGRSGPKLHPERMKRGEQNGAAKLKESDVMFIKVAARKGNYSSLGREFGVNHSTIMKIATGRYWKHVKVPNLVLDSKKGDGR